MSTTSGITFVFGRPFVASTFGENVVWVQAWKCALGAGCGRSASRSSIASLVEHRRFHVVGQVERLDLSAPQLVESGRRPIVGQT